MYKINCIMLLLSFCIFTSCTKNSPKNLKLPEKPPLEGSSQSLKQPVTSSAAGVINNPKPISENILDKNKIDTNIGSLSAPRISATIKSDNKSLLSFQTSGVIDKIYVRAGVKVKQGQVLATLNNTQAQLDLKSSEIDLQSKKLALDAEQKRYERQLEQFKAGILSQAAIDKEKNTLETIKLDCKLSQSSLESKKYMVKLTTLYAPFSGIVSKSFKSIGDYVSPGVEILELVQENNLLVYAQVPVSFYSQIKENMIFEIEDSIHATKGKMVIKRIVPIIDSSSRTFDIYGKILDLHKSVVPGEYIEIILSK